MLNAMQGRDLDPIGTPGAEAGWPTLLTRMLEDASRIVHAELRLFEANLTPLQAAAVDRAIAGLVVLHAGLFGGGCLLTAIFCCGIDGSNGGNLSESRRLAVIATLICHLYQEIRPPEGGRELTRVRLESDFDLARNWRGRETSHSLDSHQRTRFVEP